MSISPSTITSELEQCYGGAWVTCELTMGYLLGVCRDGDSYTGWAYSVGDGNGRIGTESFSNPQDAMDTIRQMALEWCTEDAIGVWTEMVKQVAERN
ncbi:MAG: hypothetical protein AAGA75_14755 [Cyanobacteria bacterium P01_E01_bin.6]